MTHPITSTAYIDDHATHYDEKRFTTPAGKMVHRIEFARLSDALTRITSEARILEVGCGTGRLLLDAREMGYSVDGLDASPDMLELVRMKAGDRHSDLKLHLGEAAAIPLDDESFELVYSIRVLNQTESTTYALSAVREMVRVTMTGGYVLIEFVNYYRPRWGAARRPTTRLRPREIKQLLQHEGCEVASTTGAFFLGMQFINLVPRPLLGIAATIDGLLSRLFPRLCSRVYVLARKGATE